MTLTQLQWIRTRPWLKHIICIWGVAICMFLAYHFASAGNRGESGKWFLYGIFCLLASSWPIMSAIIEGVRERRAGMKWIYFSDGSAILLQEAVAQRLNKELREEFERTGIRHTADWIIYDRYQIIEKMKRLQEQEDRNSYLRNN